MWHRTSNETTIPPNLLKNFNVYDTLEPQRTGAKNSDEQNAVKLIDIDECSQDSGFQDSDSNVAFLDKDRDFDLVDLYQNIFVSPQHITQNKIKRNDVAAVNSNDVDFKEFFDILESGEKIDWTKNVIVKEGSSNEELLEKPRVLIPKVFAEPDSDPEDLIIEVLTKKSIEKQILDEMSKSSGVAASPKLDIHKNIKKSDVITDHTRLNLNNSFTKDSKFESAINENVPRPSEFKTCAINSQINNSLANFTVLAMQKDEKVYKKKRVVKPVSQTFNYTKGPDFYEKSVVLPQIMARFAAMQIRLEEKSNIKKRLILDAGVKTVPKAECSNINNTNVFKKETNNSTDYTLEKKSVKPDYIPVKKDAKLCMNQSTQSIAVHTTTKTCLNCNGSSSLKKSNSPSSVASTSVKNGYGVLSPTVLMEDCNRERFRALKTSQIFKNFVLTGKYEI